MNTVNVSKQELVGGSFVQDYAPSNIVYQYASARNRPPFSPLLIREMELDPRVSFGLNLIKGRIITRADVKVKAEDEDVAEFITTTINRFWNRSIDIALRAIEWGNKASEVMYEYDKQGRVQFSHLKSYHYGDYDLVSYKGEVSGFLVKHGRFGGNVDLKNIYIGGPKAFIHLHWREYDPIHGLSRLYPVLVPWWEIWCTGGYRDIRRLWYYKNAYDGGTLYYPEGLAELPDGRKVHHQKIAQEIMEKARVGAVRTFPSSYTANGNQKKWEYQPPKTQNAPGGLADYGRELRQEILEAMGVPYEVIEASGNEGFGSSSGREIPVESFDATIQTLIQALITDLDKWVISPLVQLNWARQDKDYELIVKPIRSRNDVENDRAPQETGMVDPDEQVAETEQETPDPKEQEEEQDKQLRVASF